MMLLLPQGFFTRRRELGFFMHIWNLILFFIVIANNVWPIYLLKDV